METNDKVSVNDSKLGSRPNFWLLAEIMKRGEEGSGVVHVDRKQSDRGPVDPLMKSRRANESRERRGGKSWSDFEAEIRSAVRSVRPDSVSSQRDSGDSQERIRGPVYAAYLPSIDRSA